MSSVEGLRLAESTSFTCPIRRSSARSSRSCARLQLAGASLMPWNELLPGQPVRIESGSFAGYTGVVVRGKGNDRLIVRISLLRQSASVEFDREVLRRVR